MAFFVKDDSTSVKSFTRQTPKDDTQIGVIQSIIDLGIQTSKYGDKRQLFITFELPDDVLLEGDKKGQPLLISKSFTLTLKSGQGKLSGLRTLVNAVEGKNTEGDYDLSLLIGRGVFLNIFHKPNLSKPGEVYANIAGIMKLPKGQVIPKLVNDPIIFSLDGDDKDEVLAKIATSPMKFLLNAKNATHINMGSNVQSDDF